MNRTQGAAVTQFVYDGTMIAEELDGSGNLLRRYVPGPDGTPLVWYEGAGTGDRRWPIEDRQGSVIAVANGSGQSLATDTYDAYGLAGRSNLGRFQYAGRPFIPEVGLYDNAARSYSPTLGRFLQTDPAGYAAGMNDYAYTNGDPVNGTDPTGMWTSCSGNCNFHYESGPGGGGSTGGGSGGNGDNLGPADSAELTQIADAQSEVVAQTQQVVFDGDLNGQELKVVEQTTYTMDTSGLPMGSALGFGVEGAAYNGVFHDAVVQKLSKYLAKGGVPNLTEARVYITGTPVYAVADILANGALVGPYVIEVKTGNNPPYTDNQIAVYPHIVSGSASTYDARLPEIGLFPGALPPSPVFEFYTSGNGSKPRIDEPFAH